MCLIVRMNEWIARITRMSEGLLVVSCGFSLPGCGAQANGGWQGGEGRLFEAPRGVPPRDQGASRGGGGQEEGEELGAEAEAIYR